MKIKVSRFLSGVIAVLLLSVLCVPAFAASGSQYNQKIGFFDWLTDQNSILPDFVGYMAGTICSQSDDGYHHASTYLYPEDFFGLETPYYRCVCTYCGKGFDAYESDLKQSYDDYVSELPAPIYSPAGSLSWKIVPYVGYVCGESRASGERFADYVRAVGYIQGGYSTFVEFVLTEDFIAPIDGTYTLFVVTLDSNLAHGTAIASYHKFNSLRFAGETVAYKGGSSSAYQEYRKPLLSVGFDSYARGYWYGYLVISCTPHVPPSGGTYSTDTRPTSITGGNYGIVASDGTLNVVGNNNQIVNETTNNYYNPATGQTVPIVDWSYDYTDRSYSLTLESGSTAKVTYGDENITIKEGDTNYVIFYVVNGSGTGDDCSHEWYQTGAVKGDCINPSKRTYTCYNCGKQYTEVDPVLGHVWMTKQTVAPQYGEDGTLLQEGYTVYECNRCKELYTSMGGVAPGTSSPGSSTCAHDWKELSRTEPSCTSSGQVLFACSKCGSTRSETLNVTGHTWQILQSVQTSYDEEGNLVQQGYTIYQCSVCGEQYKDTEGVGPPGGLGSVDDGESIWEKIGNFFGSIFGGLLSMVEAILGRILDALASLSEMLMDKLTAVVDVVLSVLDEVPKLFGGFLDFLGVIFPYIPPEITLLLTFGIIAVVFIGIIKALRR